MSPKKFNYLIFFLFVIFRFNVRAQCTNGDLEASTLYGWKCYFGYNTTGGIDLSTLTPRAITGWHNVVGGAYATDLYSGNKIVAEGNYSLRLGSSFSTDKRAQVASYTFTVTAANAKFSFAYSLVLQDPVIGHALWERPFFEYWVSKTNDIKTSKMFSYRIAGKKFYADISNPFFYRRYIGGNEYAMKDYTDECVDLTKYIGKDITIYFATSGCTQGQHFGYAYIDGLCKSNNNAIANFTIPQNICNYENFIADGTSSSGETDHYWKLEKLNSNNPLDKISGSDAIEYLYNNPVSTFDLFKMYNNKGFNVNNGWYLVTLGVKTCAGDWKSISKVVELNLPDFAVPDIYRCCDDPSPLKITAYTSWHLGSVFTVPPSGTFSYYNTSGAFLGNGSTYLNSFGASPFTYFWLENEFTPPSTENAKYYVTFETPDGCKNKKTVKIINRPSSLYIWPASDFCAYNCSPPKKLIALPFYTTLPIFGNSFTCGPQTIYNTDPFFDLATNPAFTTYLWNTGETTQSIDVRDGITKYSCTVSNGCVSKIAYWDLDEIKYKLLKGSFPEPCPYPCTSPSGKIVWTDGIRVGGTAPTKFVVTDNNVSASAAPAYNATRYKLDIYNRYGEVIFTKEADAPCEGFTNKSISWDGNTTAGTDLDIGVYYFILRLWNCDTKPDDPKIIKGDITLIR